MLTNSERKWLNDRKHKAYCRYCSGRYLCPNSNAYVFRCPLIPNLQDALEFEARVAAKLAKVISNLVQEEPWPDVEVQATTPDLVLKWARLRVEEEMGG